MKLTCMICHGQHKARRDKFPWTKVAEREVEVDGKMVKETYVEGHICRKCIVKDMRKMKRAKTV